MLHVLNLERIEALLVAVPALVRAYEDRAPDLADTVKAWLDEAEATFVAEHLPQAAELALCRAGLVAAERGFVDGVPVGSGAALRRVREAQASLAVKRAAQVIADVVRARRSAIDEAARVMMQIVAVADHLGLVPGNGAAGTGHLPALLQTMTARAELTSLIVHVVGILGRADTLIVLDRAVARVRA